MVATDSARARDALRIVRALDRTDRNSDIEGEGVKSLKLSELIDVVGLDRDEVRHLIRNDLEGLVESDGKVVDAASLSCDDRSFVLTDDGERFAEQNRDRLPAVYCPQANGKRVDELEARIEELESVVEDLRNRLGTE